MDFCSIKLDIQNDISTKAENSGLFQSNPDTFVLTPLEEKQAEAANWIASTNITFKSEVINTENRIEPSDELVDAYLQRELGRKNNFSSIQPKVNIVDYRNITKEDKVNAENGDLNAQTKWMTEEISEFYEAVDGFNKGTMSIDDVAEEVLGLFRTAQQFPKVKDLMSPYMSDIQTVLNSIDKQDQYNKFKNKKTAKGQASDMTFDNLFSFINSYGQTSNSSSLFGLEQNQLEFDINTLNVVSNFLETIGVEQRLVPQFLSADGSVVKGAVALANFVESTVDIIEDIEKRPAAWNKLPEEAAHWWYRLLSTDSSLKEALWNSHKVAIKNEELYKTLYGNLVNSAEELSEESIGQLIAEAIKRIENKNAAPEDYSFLKQFVKWINSVIKIFKSTQQDPFDIAAIKILTSDVSELMTVEEYQMLVNAASIENQDVNISEQIKEETGITVHTEVAPNYFDVLNKKFKTGTKYMKKTIAKLQDSINQTTNTLTKPFSEEDKKSLKDLRITFFSKFELFTKYKNGVALNSPIRLNSAKKEEIQSINFVRERIMQENPGMKMMPTEDFVAEVDNYLNSIYTLKFRNLKKFEEYRLTDTFANINTKHNKIGVFVNDEHFSGKHFGTDPFAWYNITPFTDKSGTQRMLLHEFQTDFLDELQTYKSGEDNSLRNKQQLVANFVTKEDTYFIQFKQAVIEGKAFDNQMWDQFTHRLEELANLYNEKNVEYALNERKRSQEALNDYYSYLRVMENYLNKDKEMVEKFAKEIFQQVDKQGREEVLGKYSFAIHEKIKTLFDRDIPETQIYIYLRGAADKKFNVNHLVGNITNRKTNKATNYQLNSLTVSNKINFQSHVVLSKSTGKYDKMKTLTRNEIESIYNNLVTNYKSLIDVFDSSKDNSNEKVDFYSNFTKFYLTPLLHHSIQLSRTKEKDLHFAGASATLLTQGNAVTAELYAGPEEVEQDVNKKYVWLKEVAQDIIDSFANLEYYNPETETGNWARNQVGFDELEEIVAAKDYKEARKGFQNYKKRVKAIQAGAYSYAPNVAPGMDNLNKTSFYARFLSKSSGKFMEVGPMYTGLSKIKGLRLSYVETPGLLRNEKTYKLDLAEYKLTSPILYGLTEENEVDYKLKGTNILQSDEGKKIFKKGEKANWSLDKILTELQVPKEQKQLILDSGITDREEIITDLLVNYSYTVEINTAKTKTLQDWAEPDENGNMVYRESKNQMPTSYYSNLTVPGGTNYTENEIATPAITPSIKGHAQFATDNGIGWFRSDEQISDEELQKIVDKENKENPNSYLFISKKGKIRRILEVQSDLFQKGRDKERLTGDYRANSHVGEDVVYNGKLYIIGNVYEKGDFKVYDLFAENEEDVIGVKFTELKPVTDLTLKNDNNFLQLLNKDNNWVTFFVKSIIQDSVKKGYDKVLFPSGDTANKVEGQETLSQFLYYKETSLKSNKESIEKHNNALSKTGEEISLNGKLWKREELESIVKSFEKENAQLEKEIADAKSGKDKFSAINKFYETDIFNILKKQGFNPTRITDEYGNDWYEVVIETTRDLSPVFLNNDIISSTIIELTNNKLLHPLKTSNLFFFEDPSVLKTLDGKRIKYKRAGDAIQVLNTDGSVMSQAELFEVESSLISSYNSDSDFLQQLVRKYPPAIEVLQNFFYEQGITMSVKTGSTVYKQNGKILKDYENLDPVTVYQHLKNVGSFLYDLNKQAIKEQEVVKKGQLSLFTDTEIDNKNQEVRDLIDLSDIVLENDIAIYKNRIKYLNNTNNTSFMLQLKETRKGLVPSIIDVEMSDNTAVRAVVNQFLEIFPELTVHVINEEEIAFYLPNASPEEIANATSFVVGKDVYIIRGRVNANIALEEMLHPFISGMFEQNNELFENLYREAREQYPALYRKIKESYNYEDPEDMRKEFLTQALRNQYAGVFEKGESKSILEKFLSWFSDLWEKFKRKGLYIKDIPATATLSDMVVLLKSGVSIKLGKISNRTFYNLKETDAALYDAVLNRANAEQRDTIEQLLAASPVEFQEEGHTYVGKVDGEIYTSTTTVIKGKLEDEEKYKLNRDIGSQLDLVAQAIIVGKDLNEIIKLRIVGGVDILPNISDEVLVRFYQSFSKIVADWYAQGFVILPQLRIGDKNSKIAGSPDFVLINPNGSIESIIDLKTSKNNINSDKGGTLYESALVNPRTGKKEFISTREQHSLQVQTYRELLRLMGFDVKSLSTLHYRVGISDTSQQAVFVTIDDTAQGEGFSKHDAFVLKLASANPADGLYNLIDLILPNRADEKDYMFEAPSGLSLEDIANSSAVVLGMFKDRLTNLETQISEKLPQNHIGLEFLKDHYAQLSAVITNAEYLLNDNQPLAAYESLLDFHIEMLGRRTRIVKNHHINLANINSEEKKAEYINKIAFIVRQSQPDTQAVAGLVAKMSLLTLTPELEAKLKELNNIREDFADEAEDYLTNTFATFWMKTTAKQEITDADITEMFQSSFDIEDASLYLRDLATSNSKILGLLDRYYKFKMFEIEDSMNDLRVKFQSLTDDLLAHHKADPSVAYHFMLKKDKNGVISGNYVNELDWEKYWTKWRAAHKALENPDAIGNAEEERWLQYIENPQTQADKDFNNKLYAAKQIRNEFMRAEELIRVTDDKGWNKIESVEDGEFHQYSQEFKDIRDRFERLTDSGWARKANITAEQYAQYRKKYYTEEIEITSIQKDAQGNLTGIPIKRMTSFVKSEFVVKRLTSSTGEDMRDPQWVKIMSQKDAPQKSKEKAEYEFYVNYIEEYETGILSKLPEDIRKKMVGKIGVIKASVFSDANSKFKGNFFGKFLQNVRNYFTWDAEESSVFVDEDGNMDKKRLPIYFVGDTKNIKIIENLRKKIKDLHASFAAQSITADEHTKEFKKLKELLRIESNKVEKEQLETNLTKNLLTFAGMAEYFFKMSEMENVLSQVDDIILSTSFKKRNSIQGSLRQKGNNKEDAKILSEESNTYKRYQIWKDMVFYRNVNVYKSKGAQVVKKVMQALSLRSVGLNVFGQINNFTIGEISNAIERNRFFGGKYINTFYKPESFNRASVEYAKHVATFRFNKDTGYFTNARSGSSKYEAVINFFNAVRQNQSSLNTNDKGIVEQTGSLGYIMMEKVEFAIQSKTAMSIIMSTEVKDTTTGEMVNLFDALVFDEKTGLVSLPENIEFSKKDRYGLQNLIWEVNKAVHGNYAFEDKMTIQNTLLGEIGAQFKKFIVPAIDARFRNGYMHEERGWVEGRYLAYRDFAKYIWSSKDFKQSWDKLTDVQKMNMLKNMTELMFLLAAFLIQVLFSALKDGLPPEDKKGQLGKLLNFLSYQGSRVVNDILIFMPLVGIPNQYNTIKNPFPVMTYLKDYAEIVGAFLKSITGEGVYSTGIRKGDYKLVKEVKDVIPLINLTNKWENFATIKDFYIK